MTSSAGAECSHEDLMIHVQPRGSRGTREWVVTESCGTASCGTEREIFAAEKKGPAVQRALEDAQAKADATDRSIEVRVGSRLPKLIICGSREFWFGRHVLRTEEIHNCARTAPQDSMGRTAGHCGDWRYGRFLHLVAADFRWPRGARMDRPAHHSICCCCVDRDGGRPSRLRADSPPTTAGHGLRAKTSS